VTDPDRGDDRAFARLSSHISAAAGLGLGAYKDRCLKRRILVRMRACGVHDWEDYRRLLDREPEEVPRLLAALTINVTRFYRNPEAWRRLSEDFLPGLLAAREGGVVAWSAGCASGEEPHTLGMVLAEAARQGRADLARCRIDATDLDLASLEAARAARYPARAFEEAPPGIMERYTAVVDQEREVSPRVRALIRFARHELTLGPPPDPPYDLIVCRNVVIYFDRPTQDALFARFVDALRPGGLLMLGKVETLVGPAREALRLEDARERIYRRPG